MIRKVCPEVDADGVYPREKLFALPLPRENDLLSSLSQFLTFVFQSHVCRSISKPSPPGHRTEASLVTPFSAPLSHLYTASFYTLYSTSIDIIVAVFTLRHRIVKADLYCCSDTCSLEQDFYIPTQKFCMVLCIS